MKEIIKYVSDIDGIEFSTKEECLNHEKNYKQFHTMDDELFDMVGEIPRVDKDYKQIAKDYFIKFVNAYIEMFPHAFSKKFVAEIADEKACQKIMTDFFNNRSGELVWEIEEMSCSGGIYYQPKYEVFYNILTELQEVYEKETE